MNAIRCDGCGVYAQAESLQLLGPGYRTPLPVGWLELALIDRHAQIENARPETYEVCSRACALRCLADAPAEPRSE